LTYSRYSHISTNKTFKCNISGSTKRVQLPLGKAYWKKKNGVNIREEGNYTHQKPIV